jgi:hypothetical protein
MNGPIVDSEANLVEADRRIDVLRSLRSSWNGRRKARVRFSDHTGGVEWTHRVPVYENRIYCPMVIVRLCVRR